MKIAILGSGGREHAIALSIHNSKKTEKIYCLPGNAGTANIAENININLDYERFKNNQIHIELKDNIQLWNYIENKLK